MGLALGLSPSTLDKHTSLTDVIVEWLKTNYNVEKFGLPTWKRIVKAVGEMSGGGNLALAATLANKYSGEK